MNMSTHFKAPTDYCLCFRVSQGDQRTRQETRDKQSETRVKDLIRSKTESFYLSLLLRCKEIVIEKTDRDRDREISERGE